MNFRKSGASFQLCEAVVYIRVLNSGTHITVEMQGYFRWYPDDYFVVSKYLQVFFSKY